MKRLREIYAYVRQGGQTKRFHTVQTILPDTVGHHSFNVFWLCHLLSTHLEQVERYTLGLAAASHDLPEQEFGDVPAPAKRSMGIRELWHDNEMDLQHQMGFGYEDALTEEASRILKLCDALDGAYYCLQERMMGNKIITQCFGNFVNYAKDLVDETKPQEVELFSLVQELWSMAVL